jgi:hypothetical protein
MASLIKQPGGRWKIQFIAADQRRKTLYAGRMPKKAAATILAHVEALLAAALSKSSPEAHTATWLGSIPPKFHQKLVRLGLASPREGEAPTPAPSGPTVKEFIDRYIEKEKTGSKERTRYGAELDGASLVLFLGEGKLLADVTAGNANEFAAWLRTPASRPGKPRGYSKASIGRRLRRCSEFFRAALLFHAFAGRLTTGRTQEEWSKWTNLPAHRTAASVRRGAGPGFPGAVRQH